MNIQAIGIVRKRGQLTIPDKIRETFSWLTPSSTVTITSQKPDELVIRPISASKKVIDWDELWRDIQRVRSYRGKGGGNLSRFVVEDRQTRR